MEDNVVDGQLLPTSTASGGLPGALGETAGRGVVRLRLNKITAVNRVRMADESSAA